MFSVDSGHVTSARLTYFVPSMSTTADSDSKYIQLYVVDSEGELVLDPYTGFKLTPEGSEWDRKARLILRF
jgi:putative methionine-R-sulfoxide reductase with GAF domain